MSIVPETMSIVAWGYLSKYNSEIDKYCQLENMILPNEKRMG
jgi:hypothetical protein